MQKWETKVEEKRQAEAKKIEEKVDRGELDLNTATNDVSNLESVDQVETDKGKIHQRVVYDLVLEDSNKVEQQFWVIDLAKVKEYHQQTGQIPHGFKLEQRTIRATRLS
jgi:hypothetical protein